MCPAPFSDWCMEKEAGHGSGFTSFRPWLPQVFSEVESGGGRCCCRRHTEHRQFDLSLCQGAASLVWCGLSVAALAPPQEAHSAEEPPPDQSGGAHRPPGWMVHYQSTDSAAVISGINTGAVVTLSWRAVPASFCCPPPPADKLFTLFLLVTGGMVQT